MDELTMDELTMDETAINIVKGFISKHLDKSDKAPDFEVSIISKCKTLQNWTYIISSTISDGMYYEFTYDGDKQKWYLSAYRKFENIVIKN